MFNLKTKSGKPLFTWKIIVIIFLLFTIAYYHDCIYNEKVKYEHMYIVCENGSRVNVTINTTSACGYPCQFNKTQDQLFCGWSQLKLEDGKY